MTLQRLLFSPVADPKCTDLEHLARLRSEQLSTCANGEQVAISPGNGTETVPSNGVELTPFQNLSDLEGNSANWRNLNGTNIEPFKKPDDGLDAELRRLAMQIAVQLPESKRHAMTVLRLAGWLVTDFVECEQEGEHSIVRPTFSIVQPANRDANLEVSR